MKTCKPAKGYLPVPGPASLCAYRALLFTCGTVILLTWSCGGHMNTSYLAKGGLPGPGPTSTCNIVHLRYNNPSDSVLGGLQETCQLTKGCMPVPGPTRSCNITHMRYNNPFDLVLEGLQENLLACQRQFTSFGTNKYLQYWSLGIQLSCCSVLRGLQEIYSVKSTVSSVLALPTS